MNFPKLIKSVQQKVVKTKNITLKLGDVINVYLVIQERKKKRFQCYQGNLIAYHRFARNSTITIRRIYQGVSVERVFFFHSSIIQCVETFRNTKSRRAKLYYFRKIKGKAIRLREIFLKVLNIRRYV